MVVHEIRACLFHANTTEIIRAPVFDNGSKPNWSATGRISRHLLGRNPRRRIKISQGPIAWGPLITMVAGSLAIRHAVPSWAFMWSMLIALVGGFKWLTLCHAADRLGRILFGRSVAYLIAWPGMDSETFLDRRIKSIRPQHIEWLQAIGKLLLGFSLMCVSVSSSVSIIVNDLVAGWIGMIGFVFALHFGLFHLLALLWRSLGIEATHIFRSPARARSVGNFWGNRWNLAFRDLAHSWVFGPLVSRAGLLTASLVTFALSGVVHDLVISLPARAGYGLPTMYFLMQWCGVVVERSRLGRRLGLRRGWSGWLFTLMVVVAPLGLLFHSPFVVGVVLPFLRVLLNGTT
jgi:Membrane bound O-acyl transferase family